MMTSLGLFISIEGIEGVGKSTILALIHAYLSQKNIAFTTTREPGGTVIGERIRDIFLTHSQEPLSSETELLLVFAARAQLLKQVIIPALTQGHWVITDRFFDASFAYQGGGRGIERARITQLSDWIVNGWQPNATLLLDAPASIGLARAKNRGASDRIEQETVQFFEAVRQEYLQRAHQEPQRFYIVDATQPLSVVQDQVKAWLDRLSHQAFL